MLFVFKCVIVFYVVLMVSLGATTKKILPHMLHFKMKNSQMHLFHLFIYFMQFQEEFFLFLYFMELQEDFNILRLKAICEEL